MNKSEKKLSTAEIQKEQLFLVQLERELMNVLEKINENINTLKVEELQLRSNAVNNLGSHGSENFEESKSKAEEQPTFNDNPEIVNQQELNLEVFLSHLNNEEEEDE